MSKLGYKNYKNWLTNLWIMISLIKLDYLSYLELSISHQMVYLINNVDENSHSAIKIMLNTEGLIN